MDAGVISSPSGCPHLANCCLACRPPPSPCLVRSTQNLTTIQMHPQKSWFRQHDCQFHWRGMSGINKQPKEREETERDRQTNQAVHQILREDISVQKIFLSFGFLVLWWKDLADANWLKLCQNWWPTTKTPSGSLKSRRENWIILGSLFFQFVLREKPRRKKGWCQLESEVDVDRSNERSVESLTSAFMQLHLPCALMTKTKLAQHNSERICGDFFVCFKSLPMGRRENTIKETFQLFFNIYFIIYLTRLSRSTSWFLIYLQYNRHSMDGESMFCIKKSLHSLHEVTNNFPAKHNFSNKNCLYDIGERTRVAGSDLNRRPNTQ